MAVQSLPLVSIIMPTYGRATLLRRSILSVLAQTYTSFELIVVDDYSPDNTPEIVREFSDPRLRYIRRQENGYAAAARNDGIKAAQGELLAFQDDDDIWLPHKLERQVQAMLTAPNDVGLIVCSYIRWRRTFIRYIGRKYHFQLLDFSKGDVRRRDYSLIATPGWLVRRESLEKAGPFDTRLRSWDDWELGLRLWQICKFKHLDEPLFIQDHVNGSAMMQNEAVFANDMRIILEKHGHLWRKDRFLQARHCYVVGRGECEFGSQHVAREWLLKCLQLNPIHIRAWVVLAASFLGKAGFEWTLVVGRRIIKLRNLFLRVPYMFVKKHHT